MAPPGSEKAKDLEWIDHYGGHRLYGSYNPNTRHWSWKDFKCIEGEIFLRPDELQFREQIAPVIIEPRVKHGKINKQWPTDRYQQVADALQQAGYDCAQLVPPGASPLLRDVTAVRTDTFRRGMAAISKARLYVGAEGGLHHAAAAFGVQAVVLFGGFIGPNTTGYSWHRNIITAKPCGAGFACGHCKQAMQAITVEMVVKEALDILDGKALEESHSRPVCSVAN